MTKYRRFFAVCVVIFLGAFSNPNTACSNSPKDLTRSHAKELIEGDKYFTLRMGYMKKQVVEVTGISHGGPSFGGNRLVKFSWRFDLTGLTEKIIKEYVGYGYSGPRQVGKLHEAKAFMQLYDSGWQIDNIDDGGVQFPY